GREALAINNNLIISFNLAASVGTTTRARHHLHVRVLQSCDLASWSLCTPKRLATRHPGRLGRLEFPHQVLDIPETIIPRRLENRLARWRDNGVISDIGIPAPDGLDLRTRMSCLNIM